MLVLQTHTQPTVLPVKLRPRLIPVSKKDLQCQMMQRWKSGRNTQRAQRAYEITESEKERKRGQRESERERERDLGRCTDTLH